MKKPIIIILLITTFFSCKKENRCFDRPGETVTDTYTIDAQITSLHLYNDLNLNLINDSLDILEVTGGKNLIKNILHHRENNSLTISNSNKCLFVSNKDQIEITLHYTHLESLNLFGYGTINSHDTLTQNLTISGHDCYSTINLILDNDSTIITLEGAPQLTATGNSNYIYAYTVGKGNYHLEELSTESCHGHNKGIGDLHLRANQSYIIELRSRGDIYLYDTSGVEIFKTIEGDGSIFYP